MKCECFNDKCRDGKKAIKRVNGSLQVKWLSGCYSDHYAISVIKMSWMVCNGRGGCGTEFIFQQDYPLNPKLAIRESVHQDWGLFKSGLKNKPGTPIGGTTVSEFTQKIAQGIVPVSYLDKRMVG